VDSTQAAYLLLGCLVLVAIVIPGCTTQPAPDENNRSPQLVTDQNLVIPHRVTAVSAGGSHSLALLDDGTVVAWGSDSSGECDVPANLTDVKGISAGNGYSIAVKKDGSVVAWGCRWKTTDDEPRHHPQAPLLCDDTCPCRIPANLSPVKTVSAGESSVLALKEDGTVTAWGRNYSGECNVPRGLKNVTAVSTGGTHSLALKDDGTIVVWGRYLGRVPSGYEKYTGIAAGYEHSLLLNDKGTVETFTGAKENGLPLYHPDLRNVTAISGGSSYFAALLGNGSVVTWGIYRYCGQGMSYCGESISDGLNAAGKNITDITAISAGDSHCVALRDDGKVVAWGDCGSGGRCDVPPQIAAEVV
jgi:alpha-tubulin suppressor-like RCC1 family protein